MCCFCERWRGVGYFSYMCHTDIAVAASCTPYKCRGQVKICKFAIELQIYRLEIKAVLKYNLQLISNPQIIILPLLSEFHKQKDYRYLFQKTQILMVQKVHQDTCRPA